MTAPPVQYALSADGVAIAYAERGDGPLMMVSTGIGMPINQGWEPDGVWTRLARSFRVVRFDPRGCGLSERRNLTGSFEDEGQDLVTVLDRLEAPRAVLMGYLVGVPGAIFAVTAHRERFSHMILHSPIGAGIRHHAPAELAEANELQEEVIDRLLQLGWRYDSEPARRALFNLILPDASMDVWRDLAGSWAAHANVERLTQLMPEIQTLDFGEALAGLDLPTLLSTSGDPQGAANAYDWARAIPGAQLTVLSDQSPVFTAGSASIEELAGAVEQFALPPARAPAEAPIEATRTVLFTDVEGSTGMADRLGDAEARGIIREVEQLTRTALRDHGGTEVKTLGDGVMAWFPLASAALDAAIQLERAVSARFGEQADSLRVRIGINAGEPIEEANDIFGATVNRAARIMSEAAGGEVLVSDLVRGLVEGRRYRFDDRGVRTLRGIEEPQQLFALHWRSG